MRERFQLLIAAFIALGVIWLVCKGSGDGDTEPALIARARAITSRIEQVPEDEETEQDSTDFFSRLAGERFADWGEMLKGDSLLNHQRLRGIVQELLEGWARY